MEIAVYTYEKPYANEHTPCYKTLSFDEETGDRIFDIKTKTTLAELYKQGYRLIQVTGNNYFLEKD